MVALDGLKSPQEVQKFRDRVEQSLCEDSLYDFLRIAWPMFDPDPFVGGWHLAAIAEHLMAVSSGDIKRLLINVRPRSSKTSLVAIAWPVWTWAQEQDPDYPLIGPNVRFLCGSYGAGKAQEDAVTARRLIASEWYQRLWGHRVQICFPADQIMQTERGGLPIGRVVRERMKLNVPSWNEALGAVEMRPLTGWHINPASPLLRLTFSNGLSIRCTPCHRFRISEGNWKAAIDIPIGTSMAVFGHRSTMSVCDATPMSSGTNIINDLSRYTESGRDDVRPLQADADGGGVSVADQGVSVALPSGESAMGASVRHIIRSRSIMEVASTAVDSDTILMPHLLPVRTRTDECAGDDLVDLDLKSLTVPPEIEMRVAVGIERRPHDLGVHSPGDITPGAVVHDTPSQAPYPAERGCFVPREIRDSEPEFVTLVSVVHDGYSLETYCVTVDKNNNLMVGDNQAVIASNCRDRDNQERYDTTAGGARISTGVPESLGKGGMIKILDDPHKTTEVESDTTREQVIRNYKEIWQTRSNSPTESADVMVMQRLGEDDLSQYWIDNHDETVHLCIPTWHETDRVCTTYVNGHKFWTDPRTQEGENFWPQRYPQSYRKIDESLGNFPFAGQIQQRPEPRGGGILKRMWWQAWPPDDSIEKWTTKEGTNYPPWELQIAYLDTAFTKKEVNDYCAMTRWGVFGNDRGTPSAMLCGAWQDRLSFDELLTKVLASCRDWRTDILIIENKAGGIWVRDELVRHMRAGEFTIELDTPVVDKLARANAVVPLFSGKLIYAPFVHGKFEWRAWAEMVISSCEKFPTGRHDDLVDTVSGALGYLRRNNLIQFNQEHEEEEDERNRFKGNRETVAESYGVA